MSRPRRRHDRGAGLIGSVAGTTVFLAFVLFAVQLLVNLHTTSVVTAAAHEAAHTAATSGHADADAFTAARRRGEERARRLLGRFGDEVSFDWSASTVDTVVLRVRARAPRFTLPGLPARLGFDQIDRTVRVRIEAVR